MKMKTYIYFSGATDVTGNKIKDALKIDGGVKEPKTKCDVLIGWGTKIKEQTDFKKKATVTLNDPNLILLNRNKQEALRKMQEKEVTVGNFVSADRVLKALKDKKLNLPLIGRTNYHQGGKGFWTCLATHHVRKAINEGAQYFQEYVPIVDEYRLHVFDEEVFYISKKVQQGNATEAYVKGFGDKIKNSANKAGKPIDDATLKYALENMASRQLNDNPILKSHDTGHVFKSIAKKNSTTKQIMAMSEEAIKATKALGLDFAAVDCGIDEAGKAWVIEINTGPGLEGKTFDAWIEQFNKALKRIEHKLNPKTEKKTYQNPTVETIKTGKPKSILGSNKKDTAIMKARLLQELLENADDEAVDGIMTAASRTFSGEAAAGKKMFG